MNSQEMMEQSKQTAKKIMMGIFYAIMFVVLITGIFQMINTSNGLDAQRIILDNLNDANVKKIVLTPYHDTDSPVSVETVVADSASISQLVSAYKNMRPEKMGDGKLSGSWQLILTFVMRDGKEIESQIFHNEFADLVFISTPDNLYYSSPADFYASHEISQILVEKLTKK